MPKKATWLVLEDFDYVPRRGVVMAFRAGETRQGLTRACIAQAGNRIEKLGPAPEPISTPLGKASTGAS